MRSTGRTPRLEPRPLPDTVLTLWLPEGQQDEIAITLDTDETVDLHIARLDASLNASLAQVGPGTAGAITGRAAPAQPTDRLPPRVTGRVSRIDAVTCTWRVGQGGQITPNWYTLDASVVERTAQAIPQRSVWLPSGAPALLGFLVHLDRAVATDLVPQG